MYDDSNDNKNQEIYEDENLDKLKKASKEKVKDGVKQVGKLIGKAFKKLFKWLLSLIPPYVWLIIIGVLLVIILIAGFWYAIKGEMYNAVSDIAQFTTEDGSGNIKKITSINEDERRLEIDSKSFIEQVKEWIRNNNIEASTLGLNNDDYSTLVKFLEAEAVSSFPDLRERDKIGTPVKNGELQGIVQFKRKYDDGTEELLEYKKYTDFRAELAKLGEKLDDEETQEQIYFTKQEVENAYNQLKTYFTLDEEYNLITISMGSHETKVTYSQYAQEEGNINEEKFDFYINVSKVNYQSIVQKYTMPFEFPLALLMITNNPDFCEEVAKLAMTSQEGDKVTGKSFEPKIVIEIQDNMNSTYIKEDYGYTANFKLEDYVTYTVVIKDEKGNIVHEERNNIIYPSPIEEYKTISASSYKITENWMKTTTPQLCVSEAITWIADYTSQYNKIDDVMGPNITDSKEADELQYSEINDSHGYLASQNFSYNVPLSTKNMQIKTHEIKKIYEKKTDKNTQISTINTSTKYNKISSKIEPKWERFLSLIKIEKATGVYNLKDITKNNMYIKYKGNTSPENNLLTGKEALYVLLASNSKTVTFEQIMKDLIAIYIGEITSDKTKFDFSIYESADFSTIGTEGKISYDNIQISDEDVEILCKITSAERGNGTQQQQEYVTSVILNRVLCSKFPNTIKGVVFASGQFQPVINGAYDKAKPSETTKAAVRNVIENGDTTGGALYFCTPAASSQNGWWSTLKFLFNDNNGLAVSHDFYTTEEGQEELNQYIGIGSGGTVVEEAAKAHEYVEKNGYSYAQVGLVIPNGILNGKTIDCSSYVSWVLYNSGFSQFGGNQKTSSTFRNNPWGWQTIPSISAAKAGDILVYNGHVEIYSGELSGNKAKVYNCGGNISIRSKAPSNSGYTVNQIIKIIRPPA